MVRCSAECAEKEKTALRALDIKTVLRTGRVKIALRALGVKTVL